MQWVSVEFTKVFLSYEIMIEHSQTMTIFLVVDICVWSSHLLIVGVFTQVAMESSVWRTWSTRSTQTAHTSRRLPTSCGHSSWTHPMVDGDVNTTTSTTVVTADSEKHRSTRYWETWFKLTMITMDLPSWKIKRKMKQKVFWFDLVIIVLHGATWLQGRQFVHKTNYA